MLRVLKFVLDPHDSEVKVAGFVRIVSIESQRSAIVMYALVETHSYELTYVPYRVFATGEEVYMVEEMRFDTVKLHDDSLIFHVMTGKDYWVAYDGKVS